MKPQTETIEGNEAFNHQERDEDDTLCTSLGDQTQDDGLLGRSHEGCGSAASSERGLRVAEAEHGTRAIGLLRADGREQDDVGNASSFDGSSYRACAAIVVRAHLG
jgi:hypothetical protein